MERGFDPVEERHPVERLESHLGDPRSCDEEDPQCDDRLELLFDVPHRPEEAPLLLELALPPECRAHGTPDAAEPALHDVDHVVANALAGAANAVARIRDPFLAHLRRQSEATGHLPQPLAREVARRARPARHVRRPSRTGEAAPKPSRTTSTARMSSSTKAPHRSPEKTRLATSRWSKRKPEA